jgi:hypothetical protein
MSSDDNLPIGQKRQGALQLGPRKKACVPRVALLLPSRTELLLEFQL